MSKPRVPMKANAAAILKNATTLPEGRAKTLKKLTSFWPDLIAIFSLFDSSKLTPNCLYAAFKSKVRPVQGSRHKACLECIMERRMATTWSTDSTRNFSGRPTVACTPHTEKSSMRRILSFCWMENALLWSGSSCPPDRTWTTSLFPPRSQSQPKRCCPNLSKGSVSGCQQQRHSSPTQLLSAAPLSCSQLWPLVENSTLTCPTCQGKTRDDLVYDFCIPIIQADKNVFPKQFLSR